MFEFKVILMRKSNQMIFNGRTTFSSSSSSSKRNESSYSATSLNAGPRMLQRKSQARDASFISSAIRASLGSDIRQRVLSARQHRQKSLQNQLNVALQQNAVFKNT